MYGQPWFCCTFMVSHNDGFVSSLIMKRCPSSGSTMYSLAPKMFFHLVPGSYAENPSAEQLVHIPVWKA